MVEDKRRNLLSRTKAQFQSYQDKIGFDLLKSMIIICFGKLDLRETKKTISYLLLLSKYALDLIDQYVDGEFTNPNVEQNVVCFRQCMKLWKLTEELQNDEIKLIRERLVFKMLGFVDNENPLLRYSAKTWLQLSLSQFHNILDLIFVQLLTNTTWYYRPDVTYQEEYSTTDITLCIKHLKNMLINLGDSFCQYIMDVKIKQNIHALIPKLGERKIVNASGGVSYEDVLAVICLRYIEADVKEETSTFYMRNLSVKATACEFLEMLLSKQPKKEAIAQISFYLLDPLSSVLKRSVDKDESSILIQILGVLKVILFNSNFHLDKNFQEKYFTFLQKKQFLDTLIQGLSSKHLYIVLEFKDFICNLISIASENMRHPQLTDIVSKILHGYYSLISANNAGFVRIRKQQIRQQHSNSKATQL